MGGVKTGNAGSSNLLYMVISVLVNNGDSKGESLTLTGLLYSGTEMAVSVKTSRAG